MVVYALHKISSFLEHHYHPSPQQNVSTCTHTQTHHITHQTSHTQFYVNLCNSKFQNICESNSFWSPTPPPQRMHLWNILPFLKWTIILLPSFTILNFPVSALGQQKFGTLVVPLYTEWFSYYVSPPPPSSQVFFPILLLFSPLPRFFPSPSSSLILFPSTLPAPPPSPSM